MRTVSPYADALGIRPAKDSPARLVFTPGSPAEGWPGLLHGGAIAALLEAAGYAALAGAAVSDGSGPTRFKPITLTVDFLRGGRLVETFAEGRVTRLGNRIANVAVEAWQDDRARPIAGARLTFRVARDRAA